MGRVRPMFLASALTVAVLGAGSTTRAQYPAGPPPAAPATPPPAPRGPIRNFFVGLFGKSTTKPRPSRDWTTGRDDRLSKPWIPAGR